MTTTSVRAATQPARILASLLLGAAMLAGCDSALFDDPIRQAVRATLKDPDSARFGAVVQGEGYACIRYNARNGFGGYAGESWAALRMEVNGWRVLDGDVPTCDQGSLRQLAARDKAQAEKNKAAAAEVAEGQIKAVFVARGLLPRDALYLHQLPPGPCRDRAYWVRATAALALEAKDAATREAVTRRFDQELLELTTFPCP